MAKKNYFSKKIKSKLEELVNKNINPFEITSIINKDFESDYSPKFIITHINKTFEKSWSHDRKQYLSLNELAPEQVQFDILIPKSSNPDSQRPPEEINKDSKTSSPTEKISEENNYKKLPSLYDNPDCNKIDYIINCLETLNKNMEMLNTKLKTIENTTQKLRFNNTAAKLKDFAADLINLIGKHI